MAPLTPCGSKKREDAEIIGYINTLMEGEIRLGSGLHFIQKKVAELLSTESGKRRLY